jgi:hypothetical protein
MTDEFEKSMMLENLSDDDLLTELQRRGRLSRAEEFLVVPERNCADYPEAEQILSCFKSIGHDIGRKAGHGMKLPGCVMETVKGDGTNIPNHVGGRRYTAVLNFVVEKS